MTPYLSLSDDLIENLLLQLPVKSLLRFQTVCNGWRHLITSERFIKKHYLTYNMTTTTFILTPSTSSSAIFSVRNNSLGFRKVTQLYGYHNTGTSPPIKKPRLRHHPPISASDILHSTSDSLICAHETMHPHYFVRISNPFTGKHCRIPVHEIFLKEGNCSVALAFDPAVDDYKIVLAPYTLKRSRIRRIHVVTVKTKMVQFVDDTTPYRLSFHRPVALNGFVYWIGKDLVETSEYAILRFDLAHNKFHVIPPPTGGQGTCQKLQCYNTRLCLFLYATDHHHVLDNGGVIDVWVLQLQNGVCWRKESTIPWFPCPELNSQLFSYKPIGLIRNGELLMKRRLDGSLILYSPKFNKVLKVDIENSPNSDVQLLEDDILAYFLVASKRCFYSFLDADDESSVL